MKVEFWSVEAELQRRLLNYHPVDFAVVPRVGEVVKLEQLSCAVKITSVTYTVPDRSHVALQEAFVGCALEYWL